MWKLSERGLIATVASCGATLALVVACSSDDTSGGDFTSGGSSGAPAGGGAGAPAGGKSGGGSSGSSSAGTSSGGSATGGTGGVASGGGGAANGGGGAASAGASSGGAGAANGGSAGTAGSGGAPSGAAGAGEAGDGQGEGGVGGAPVFTPVEVPLLNSGFENGDNFEPGNVKDWQTSGDLASYVTYDQASAHAGYGRLAMWDGTTAYKVSTFQTVTGLANGTYQLAAWVEGASTGINALYLYAEGYSGNAGDPQLQAPITPGATYAQYTLGDIQVTSGTLTVGVYADAVTNAWINLDDITLFRVE